MFDGLFIHVAGGRRGEFNHRYGQPSVQYTPSFVWYTDNSDLSTVNHAVSAEGQLKQGPWQLNLSQGYLRLFDTSVDAGTYIGRDVFTTQLSGQYEISPKTSLEVNGRQYINCFGNQDATSSSSANSYSEWVGEVFGNYQFSPKLKGGIGVTAGWIDNKESVDGMYQQVLARAIYGLTEKLDVLASIGAQIQEFDDYQGESRDNRINGIFSLGITYRPVEKTLLGFGAYRRDNSSISLFNEAYTATGFELNLRQSLTDRITFGLGGGFTYSDYYSTIKDAGSGRSDNNWRVQVGLDFQLMENLTASVFYQYRQDDSSGSTSSSYSFQNNQVGLNVSYRF